MAIIECENLVKIYKTNEIEVIALQGLDLTVEKGELMALIGKSGSGKSTLLNMLGALDTPTAGRLTVDGYDMLKIKKRELVRYKRNTVGFVWQNNGRNLLPYLTAVENVMQPMVFTGQRNRRARAKELLELVGLGHRFNNKLFQLSGGEQQRVAIAIAMANRPSILLADEPTGAVDTKTADLIFDNFRTLNREYGQTIIVVTHDNRLASKVDRVVGIRDGRNSTEYIRRESYAEELSAMKAGEKIAAETHSSWLVLDRTGRLQLPAEYIEKLDIAIPGRLSSKISNGQIILDKSEISADCKDAEA